MHMLKEWEKRYEHGIKYSGLVPDSTHAVSGQIDGVYYELGKCRDYMDRDDDSISSDS